MQQNRCGGKYETINYISEISKLAQKSIRLDTIEWVKVIRWELCKKF